MRITNSTMTTTFMRNLTRNLNQMQKYHNQLSSGKLVSKPSDNPMLVSKIMSLNNNVMQNNQYGTNIKDTIGWVDTQDTALNSMSGTLNRARDLIIYASNGPLSDTDRAAIKDEMVMKVGELADALNTNFDGRYIFGGQKTTTKPYELVEVTEDGKTYEVLTYMGYDNNISREISPGVEIEMVTNGERVTGKEDELGKLLKEIIVAMESKEGAAKLSDDFLGTFDEQIDNVIRVRSNIGAIQNRLDSSLSRNETEKLNISKLLSEKEDIDVAEKYMEFSVMSSVYKASLSVGAQILQPSLLDYLR